MAESLGIAAGVIQFIDIGLRLSSKLSRLCSDISDAPQIIRNLRTDLHQQLEIAQDIRANNLSTFRSATSANLVDTPLYNHVTLINDLDNLLESLVSEDGDNIWRRGWKGICMAKIKEHILATCERLERQKSSLLIWLTETNLKLCAELKTNFDQAHQSIQQTAFLAQRIDENSTRNVATTELIRPQVDRLNQTSMEVLANTEYLLPRADETYQMSTRILAKIEEMLPQFQHITLDSSSTRLYIEQIGVDTNLIAREIQSIRDDWSQIHAHIHSNPTLHNPATQTLTQMEPDSSLGRWGLSSDHHNQLIEAESQLYETSASCTCRSKSSTSRWKPLSMLQFRRTFRTHHHSYCPRYTTSDQSLELMMRYIPPLWILGYSVNLSLQIKNWNTRKGLSISPIVIGTSRIVDTTRSPAFQALLNTREKLKACGFKQSALYISDLQTILQSLYQNQHASPLDEDYQGNTLLHEVLFLYRRHQTRGVRSIPGDEYISLIQFLLDSGADPNVISTGDSKSWDKPFYSSGTALDIFAPQMVDQNYLISQAEEIRNTVIYKKMVENRCEFSQPLTRIDEVHPHFYFMHFREDVLTLRRFQEQVELSDHEYLISTIVQKSEKDFLRVIKKANINHASSVNGLTALHFAVEWPQALKCLIDAGANVNAEDHYGRRPIHLAVTLGFLESVDLLLQADCGLVASGETRTTLQEALIARNTEKDIIIDDIVGALIDRHDRLLSHARAVLTKEELSSLGVSQCNKSERLVPDIKKAMLSHNFQLPDPLILDNRGVYNTADMHGYIRMTPRIAEMLWQGGFKDIDSPDENGLTPILQSWFVANFDMVAWFMQKGVNEFSQHIDAPLHGLHLYAVRMAYPGGFFRHNPELLECNTEQITRLQKELRTAHDVCSCLCSTDECTPVSILMKNIQEDPQSDRSRVEKSYRCWLEKTAPSPALLKQYSKECTRSLIFAAMKLKHSCCNLGQECAVYPREPENNPQVIAEYEVNKRRLEDYLVTYEEAYHTHPGPIEMLPFDFLDTFVFKRRQEWNTQNVSEERILEV